MLPKGSPPALLPGGRRRGRPSLKEQILPGSLPPRHCPRLFPPASAESRSPERGLPELVVPVRSGACQPPPRSAGFESQGSLVFWALCLFERKKVKLCSVILCSVQRHVALESGQILHLLISESKNMAMERREGCFLGFKIFSQTHFKHDSILKY